MIHIPVQVLRQQFIHYDIKVFHPSFKSFIVLRGMIQPSFAWVHTYIRNIIQLHCGQAASCIKATYSHDDEGMIKWWE